VSAGDDLDRALARLGAAVERVAAPVTTSTDTRLRPGVESAVVARKTPHRDADGRITHVVVEMSDGRRFRKRPVRDALHRIVDVVIERLQDAPPVTRESAARARGHR